MSPAAPFDAPTLAALARLHANPFDVFGEHIAPAVETSGILRTLSAKPMRAPQLAARLSARRFALEMALVVLIACGQVVRDDEAFLSVPAGEHA